MKKNDYLYTAKSLENQFYLLTKIALGKVSRIKHSYRLMFFTYVCLIVEYNRIYNGQRQ